LSEPDQLTLFELSAGDIERWAKRRDDETPAHAEARALEIDRMANELAARNCPLSAEILRGCARRLRAANAPVITLPADCEQSS